MKRTRFIIATMLAYFLCLGGVLPVNAQEPEEEEIEFSVDWGDPTPIDPGTGKGPILMPHRYKTDVFIKIITNCIF